MLNTNMKMLIDLHPFVYKTAIPWPSYARPDQWQQAVDQYNSWLRLYVGPWLQTWAWSDSRDPDKIGVAFKYDQDRMIFVLAWSGLDSDLKK
jgi:hypothetical protein